MTDENLDPLPEDLALLLAREARAYEGDTALVEGVRRSVDVALGLRDGGGGNGHNGSGGNGGGGAAASVTGARLGAKKALVMASLASFVVGTAVGVVATRATLQTSSPSPTASLAERTTANPHDVESARVPTIAVSALPSVVSPAAAVAPPSTAAGEVHGRSDLRRERELVDAARSALAGGRGSEALSSIDRHTTLFPNGQLAEERESLRIHALVATGRRAEAEAQAAQFRRRFPNSALLASVEAALRREEKMPVP